MMTVQEMIEALDGYGLTITDDDLIEERIRELGAAPFDQVTLTTPGGRNAISGDVQPPREVTLNV
jgi:hypothetical protein